MSSRRRIEDESATTGRGRPPPFEPGLSALHVGEAGMQPGGEADVEGGRGDAGSDDGEDVGAHREAEDGPTRLPRHSLASGKAETGQMRTAGSRRPLPPLHPRLAHRGRLGR